MCGVFVLHVVPMSCCFAFVVLRLFFVFLFCVFGALCWAVWFGRCCSLCVCFCWLIVCRLCCGCWLLLLCVLLMCASVACCTCVVVLVFVSFRFVCMNVVVL